MAEAFKACRAASQSISVASNGGRGSQETADACSPHRQAIRRRHSAVDEGRGGRVVARHIVKMILFPILQQLWNILTFDPQKTDVDEHIDLINTLGDMLGQTAESKMEMFIDTMPTIIQTHLITCKTWA